MLVSARNQSRTLERELLHGKKEFTPYSVYACSKEGCVIEIDFHDVSVKNVHKLNPTAEEHNTNHSGLCLPDN